ncbi:DUF1289 domain-containing protein [Methyloglobulus sp.]|jgi:uncharacterized protein|uniref:DUF1289 domain-containing protein n=1 Tax=Methyloglobulus sp. TaxID=2518622 RepID=UPI0032B74B78
MAEKEEIPSPCNDNCDMDDEDICMGCFRSFMEVVTWTKVDANTRELFVKNIAERRKLYNDKLG